MREVKRQEYWCSSTGRYIRNVANATYTEMSYGPTKYTAKISQERDLNSNPNWKLDIAKHRDASRPYFNRKWELFIPQRFRYGFHKNIVASQYYRGDCIGSSPWDPSTVINGCQNDDDLRDLALARIKRKLATQKKSMNAMVPLAEIRELRGLIKYLSASYFQWIQNILRLMARPHSAKTYARLMRDISEAWLVFSFAVKPTVEDIKSTIEAIENYLGEPPRAVVLRGAAKRVWATSGDILSTTYPAIGFLSKNRWTAFHELVYTYTAGFWVNLHSANNYSTEALKDQFGLRLSDVPGTIWEIIPFSWLFDYFTTMGAFLEDTFVWDAGETEYCTLSRKYKCYIGLENQGMQLTSDRDIVTNPVFKGGAFALLEFERTTHPRLPHRSLRFKTMDEIGVNAINRLLNLTALLANSDGKRIMRG